LRVGSRVDEGLPGAVRGISYRFKVPPKPRIIRVLQWK
jgi:hypothetical protein